jgi:hypothetical protein
MKNSLPRDIDRKPLIPELLGQIAEYLEEVAKQKNSQNDSLYQVAAKACGELINLCGDVRVMGLIPGLCKGGKPRVSTPSDLIPIRLCPGPKPR